MLPLEPEIEREYLRVQEQLFVDFPFADTKYLKSHDVLRAHFLIANHFYLEGQGLGGIGPKDSNLLQSAISRQFVSIGNARKWESLFDVTATLFYGLIKNHPFYDANKRTALLSALYQLYKSGWCPTVGEKEIEDFTVEIAENNLSKHARYRELCKSGDQDPEVRYISYFFKNNSRKIDNVPRAVTYRELAVILNRFDVFLENPHGNYIEVIKRTRKSASKRFFGLLAGKDDDGYVYEKVGQIGFPRWTAQVNATAIKSVRNMTNLTAKDGVDSGAFYRGLDPIQSLITTYNAPLMRLADR